MAKMQRWRRGRSAGEEHTSADDASTETATDLVDYPVDGGVDEPEDDVVDEPEDAEPAGEPEDEADHVAVVPAEEPPLPHVEEHSGVAGFRLGARSGSDYLPLLLLQAAHAKQAITAALVVGLVAVVSGRPAREAGVVLLTVLVGQVILGWHNDIVDRRRDEAHGLTSKPLATGRLDPGTVWYAIIVATLLLVPLSVTTGIRAGCVYLASVAVGMLGNVVLRTGFFSWWSWVVSFALIPAYLSYGGWGGQAIGNPPEPVIVVLAGLLGIGVHFMRAVWGLVADHEDGWTHLPLKLGLTLGATRLLALSTVYTVAVVIALGVVGAQVGLSR